MSELVNAAIHAPPVSDATEHYNAVAGLIEALRQDAVPGADPLKEGPPLVHHFANGVYGREIHMAAGTLIIGKIHKHACLNVLAKGYCTVTTGAGPVDLVAPAVWVSEPGAQRLVFNHTDTVWITAHATELTDVPLIEDEMVAATHEEYIAWQYRTERLQ